MPQLIVAGAFAVLGAAAASAAGVAVATGIQIGFLVGSVVGMALFPTTIEGPRTNDFRVTDSAYKVPIPRVYVAGRVGGNVIQVGPVVQVKNERKVGIGSRISEYTNFRTFAVQLCEGEVVSVLRIWANDELIYDERAHNRDELGEVTDLREGIKRKFDFTHTVYVGSEDQQPDPDMEEVVGSGNQPAYRGTAYVVFRDFPLSEFGDQMPRFQFEVVLSDDVWSHKNYDPIVDAGDFPNGEFRHLLSLWLDDARPHLMYGIVYQDHDDTYVTEPRHHAVRWNAWTGQVLNSRRLTYQTAAEELFEANPEVSWASPIVRPLRGDRLFAVYSVVNVFNATNETTWFVALDPETLRLVRKSATPGEAGYPGATKGFLYACQTVVADVEGRVVFARFSDSVGGLNGRYGLWYPEANLTSYFTGVDLGAPTTLAALCFDDASAGRLWASYREVGTNDIYIEFYDIIAGVPFRRVRHFVATGPVNPTGPQSMSFDPDTQEFLIWCTSSGNDGHMIRFSIETRAASSTWFNYTNGQSVSFLGGGQSNYAGKEGRMTSETFFAAAEDAVGEDGVYLLNAETGEETYYPRSLWDLPAASEIDFFSNVIYERFSDVAWGNWVSLTYTTEEPLLPVYEGLLRLFFRRADSNTGELGTILEDLLSDSDEITAADYDFVNQTQVVRGFTVDNRMTIRSAIQALQPAFFFDVVESDWQLKGVNRGGSVFVTIEDDHLGAGADPNAHVERLTVTRVNEQELPAWVDYGFFDVAKDYLTNTVPGRRPGATMNSQNVILVDVPVVMNAQEASDNVKRFLSSIWSGRELSKLTTWLYYVSLEPGDSFRVIRNGRVRRFRVSRLTVGANFALEIEGISENDELPSAGYALTGSPPDVSGFPPGEIAVMYPPKLTTLDTALLRDDDNTPGIYVGAGPALPSDEWRGAVVSKSASPTSGFVQVASVPASTVAGYADNELPAPDDWTQWDRDSVLYVQLDGEQTLTSSTEDEVLDDYAENLFAISNPDGGWELCQFVSAVQQGERLWYLSTLLRGRLGTEQHRSGHSFGDRVVFLDQVGVAPANYAASEIGATRYYRATASGLAPEGPAVPVVQTTRRLLPYAPFDVAATRDGSGNITITWIRRSRSPGPFLWDAPLFEDEEAYQVVVRDGYSEVRTISATAESASYTVAMQVEDFGGPLSEGLLAGSVYQISSTVGRGYPAEFEGL